MFRELQAVTEFTAPTGLGNKHLIVVLFGLICVQLRVHLLLQQLGGGSISAALPSCAVKVRPGQDAVEGGRVLQSKVRLQKNLQHRRASAKTAWTRTLGLRVLLLELIQLSSPKLIVLS